MGNPAEQRAFYDSFLIPFLRGRLQRPAAPDVFYIFGNGDWRANEGALEEARLPRLHYVHAGVHPFLDGARIAGMNCVSPTPIRLKDWERWESERSAGSRPDGFRSASDGSLHAFTFVGREQEELLDAELDRLDEAIHHNAGDDAAAHLVCVFHSPPFGTACDQIGGGVHVGSHAVRRFLTRAKPVLSLHGHIHESPAVSGAFVDRVEQTVCVNPGQTPSALHAVSFRMADIPGSLRHTLLGPRGPIPKPEPRSDTEV